MSKRASDATGGKRFAPNGQSGKPFKKNEERGKYGKPEGGKSFGEGKPFKRKDSDAADRPFSKNKFEGRKRRDDDGRKPFRNDSDRAERPGAAGKKSFGEKKTYGDRERTERSDFKGEKRFRSEERGDAANDDRRPSFNKDKRYGGERGEGMKRPGKPSFEKDKRYKSNDERSGDKTGTRKPSFDKDKRYKAGEERNEGSGERRSYGKDRNYGDRSERGEGQEGRAARKPYSDKDKKFKESDERMPRKEYRTVRPDNNNEDGADNESAQAESRPPFNRERRPGREGASRKPADSRPFRERKAAAITSGTDRKGKLVDKKGKAEEATKTFSDVVKNAFNEPRGKGKAAAENDFTIKPQQFEDKVYGALEDVQEAVKKPYERPSKKIAKKEEPIEPEKSRKRRKYKDEEEETESRDDMPLNKFIAHSGECSRRDAAELVKQGKVKVNGELVMDPGYRVQQGDSVTLIGKKLTPTKGFVYLLLNKPKGYITTNEDPQGRRTVMELMNNAGVDRLFPVGRLDRDTTGLLLITNDGNLTQRLCHPSFNIKKVYHVTLDKPLTKADFDTIMAGVELEDGKAVVDEMAYLEKKDELGLEIHSGKNRIVRRIFESLGYVVEKLDRMMYAGLTKKNLPRGKWRKLTEHEIVLLKHFKS